MGRESQELRHRKIQDFTKRSLGLNVKERAIFNQKKRQ